jgi:hypothetical protein
MGNVATLDDAATNFTYTPLENVTRQSDVAGIYGWVLLPTTLGSNNTLHSTYELLLALPFDWLSDLSQSQRFGFGKYLILRYKYAHRICLF